MKATPLSQMNIHIRPVGKFSESVTLRHISYVSNELVWQSRWDDPLVRRKDDLLLGNDDTAAWKFIDRC